MKLENFHENVLQRGEDECWPWMRGTYKNGYGQLTLGSYQDGYEKAYSHRIAYELANGSFDKTLHVLHKCDNPICCNPKHLFLGTVAANMEDRWKKGRAVRKVDAEMKKEMQKMRTEGAIFATIAKRFGVTIQCVRYHTDISPRNYA